MYRDLEQYDKLVSQQEDQSDWQAGNHRIHGRKKASTCCGKSGK